MNTKKSKCLNIKCEASKCSKCQKEKITQEFVDVINENSEETKTEFDSALKLINM